MTRSELDTLVARPDPPLGNGAQPSDAVVAAAKALHLTHPVTFPRPDWETWDVLSDQGKRRYLDDASTALNALASAGYSIRCDTCGALATTHESFCTRTA